MSTKANLSENKKYEKWRIQFEIIFTYQNNKPKRKMWTDLKNYITAISHPLAFTLKARKLNIYVRIVKLTNFHLCLETVLQSKKKKFWFQENVTQQAFISYFTQGPLKYKIRGIYSWHTQTVLSYYLKLYGYTIQS